MSFIPASFRPCLRQPLFRTSVTRKAAPSRSFHPSPSFAATPQEILARRTGQVADSIALARARSARPSQQAKSSRSLLYALGLGTSFLAYNSLRTAPGQCEGIIPTTTTTARGSGAGLGGDEPAPQSILSVYELGFGTVAGICAGVFLKKGLRAIAFLLGGAFIFLQYLSSKSYVTVDWARLSRSYDSTFGTRTSAGGSKAPTVQGVWNRLVDFVTANFQQRASFLAGFLLGVRLG